MSTESGDFRLGSMAARHSVDRRPLKRVLRFSEDPLEQGDGLRPHGSQGCDGLGAGGLIVALQCFLQDGHHLACVGIDPVQDVGGLYAGPEFGGPKPPLKGRDGLTRRRAYPPECVPRHFGEAPLVFVEQRNQRRHTRPGLRPDHSQNAGRLRAKLLDRCLAGPGPSRGRPPAPGL